MSDNDHEVVPSVSASSNRRKGTKMSGTIGDIAVSNRVHETHSAAQAITRGCLSDPSSYVLTEDAQTLRRARLDVANYTAALENQLADAVAAAVALRKPSQPSSKRKHATRSKQWV
jgi:hypothetical protein